MSRLANASIRTLLGCVIGSLGFLLLAVNAVTLVASIGVNAQARLVAATADATARMQQAAHMLRLERAETIVALASEAPSGDADRASIRLHRGQAEAMYARSISALAVLRAEDAAGTITGAIAKVAAAHENLDRMRAASDDAISRPRAARDPRLNRDVPASEQAMLDALVAATATLEHSLSQRDPRVAHLIEVEQAATKARTHLAAMWRLFLQALPARRPVTTEDVAAWLEDRAVARAAWATVTEAIAAPDTPAPLAASAALAAPSYGDANDAFLKDLIAALATGHADDLAFHDVYQRSREVERTDSVIAAAMDAMIAQAEAAAARARRQVIFAAAVTLAGTWLSVCGFVILRRRVEQPILALTGVIARLAEQDFSVEIPPKTHDDEIGRMQSALLALRAKGLANHEAVTEVNRSLTDLANVDGLTGLYNRRRLDEALSVEWLRGAREQQPISLLMVDVDYFKKFNDHYGHQAGDACLRKVAAAIGAVARRPTDIAARFGGEEFVLLLSNTEAAGVVETARRLQAAIRELAIAHAESPFGVVTLSIGLATVIPDGDGGVHALVADADRGVYRAKRDGRNRTCWGAENEDSPMPALDAQVSSGERSAAHAERSAHDRT